MMRTGYTPTRPELQQYNFPVELREANSFSVGVILGKVCTLLSYAEHRRGNSFLFMFMNSIVFQIANHYFVLVSPLTRRSGGTLVKPVKIYQQHDLR